MKNQSHKIILGAWILILIISCNSENVTDEYYQKLGKFEEDWRNCFDHRFSFPSDSLISSLEYMQCEIDSKPVLINNNSTGFEGTKRFVSKWESSSSSLQLNGYGTLKNSLLITFFNKEYFKHIALVVNYPTDSLNYTLQHLQNGQEIQCASNFEYGKYAFQISTHCDPNDQVLFSTQYSEENSQMIRKDSISYKYFAGDWYYHIEYSFDKLILSNINWNSMTKIDMFGKPRESDILVESVNISDMKCVIEFDIPED